MVAVKTKSYNKIIAKPFAPNLGAEIYEVDLSKPISDEQFEEIHHAFLQYQVLFFKNQKVIPPEIHIDFGKKFGELHAHPAAPTMDGHPEILKYMQQKILKWLMVSIGTQMCRVMKSRR